VLRDENGIGATPMEPCNHPKNGGQADAVTAGQGVWLAEVLRNPSCYTLMGQSAQTATKPKPGDDSQLSLICRVLFHGINFNPRAITQRPKKVTMMVPRSSSI
jgi:hypothetical protein